MKVRVLFLLATTMVLVPVFAQIAPEIEWQRALGGSGADNAESIVQTNDGGFLVVGRTGSYDGDVTNQQGNGDYWVVRLDIYGTPQWQKTLGGSGGDWAESVVQTADGGCIVAGRTQSNDGDVTNNHGSFDFWIVKLDDVGGLEWQKTLGGSGIDMAFSICQTNDGGYIVAGSSSSTNGDVSTNQGGLDCWVVKLNGTGDLEWEKSFGGSGSESVSCIVQTSDGGYIMTGRTDSFDGDVTNQHGLGDYWVVKLDATGIIEWQKCYGGSGSDAAYSIIESNDGGYLVAGNVLSSNGDVTVSYGSGDVWVVKLDNIGSLQWQKSFGGSDADFASSIAQTSDGGYVLSGDVLSSDVDVTSNHGSSDYWILKLDDTGSLQWQKTIGGSNNDVATSIASEVVGLNWTAFGQV